MSLQEIEASYKTHIQEAKTNCKECYNAFQNEQNAPPNLVYTTSNIESFNGDAMNALQNIINTFLNNENKEDFSDEENQLLDKLKNQKLSAGSALNSCVDCDHESKRICRILAQ